jgi:3-hydroxybutyrate dehydrogenase
MSTVKLPQSELMDALNARPKHVFVSGASRGIGEAVSRQFGEDNFQLSLASRSYNRTLGICMDIGEDKSHPLRMDLADESSIDAAVAAAESRFGPIDILINNAGLNMATPLGDCSEEGRQRFREIIEVNLVGTYFLTQLVCQHMPAGGRVLFVGSVLARFGVAGSHAYTASKHAVMGLVRGMAHELAERDIRVNAINPGWVDTKMAHDSLRRIAASSGQTVQKVTVDMLGAQPVRRMLKPSEVARYVAFLVGPQGDGITGQGIDMSCGSFMV